MPIYRIATYSFEEHREISLYCDDLLTQAQLNTRFQAAMFACAKKMPRKRRSDFGDVFEELTKKRTELLVLQDLFPQKAILTSYVHEWGNSDGGFAAEGACVDNITNSLTAQLRKARIRVRMVPFEPYEVPTDAEDRDSKEDDDNLDANDNVHTP